MTGSGSDTGIETSESRKTLENLLPSIGILGLILLASCRPSADHLLLAAKQGDVEQTRRLLDRGLPITVTDREGQTSLHIAARWGREAVTTVLLDRGAPIEAGDPEGRTPLHEPPGRGHDAVVRLLLDRGAAVEALDHHRWTPLHLATFHGREPVVRLLLDRGAQANRGDAQGVTPLHGAAYFGYEGIQQLLIQRGATTDLVDDRGYTAAQYAKRQGKSGSPDDVIPAETVQRVSAASAGVARLHLPLIKIDGSSTVYPLSELVAERYTEAGGGTVRVTVGISGAGGGFQKFCRGETDVQDASRPISASELELCQTNGVQFFELPVGYDALSVVVNANNTWVESLTLKELKAMWEPAAHMKTTSWNQIRRDWPAAPLKLFGAGPDSESFDYFTEVGGGKRRRVAPIIRAAKTTMSWSTPLPRAALLSATSHLRISNPIAGVSKRSPSMRGKDRSFRRRTPSYRVSITLCRGLSSYTSISAPPSIARSGSSWNSI